MFTEAGRSQLLDELVDRARVDPAIAAAALIDTADVVEVADRWTAEITETVTVADTLDVWAGPVLYRVFLLHDSLQLDLSLWPAGTLARERRSVWPSDRHNRETPR